MITTCTVAENNRTWGLLWFAVLSLLLILPSWSQATDPTSWTTLEPGLELANFPTNHPGIGGDSTVAVLRADPALWSLDLLSMTDPPGGLRLTARQWCREYGLTVAINGGMFDLDYQTHVGYCSAHGHTNSSTVTEYQSVAASNPRKTDIPPFRIFDLDQPGITIDTIKEDYNCLAQNLRLIKRPGENRWTQQPKQWSEAALGEDAQGRILFIFCRTGYSMYDLNEILLSLPLDLVCAQHLEGGPEAQLYIRTDEFEAEFLGSYETNFFESGQNQAATQIPVIFGLRPRDNHDPR